MSVIRESQFIRLEDKNISLVIRSLVCPFAAFQYIPGAQHLCFMVRGAPIDL